MYLYAEKIEIIYLSSSGSENIDWNIVSDFKSFNKNIIIIYTAEYLNLL